MASTPYLAITLDLKRRIGRAARAVGMDVGAMAWGVLELLEHVWERKSPAISALVITSCFGPGDQVASALVEFGLLIVAEDGWELCKEEADRLLRPRQSRPHGSGDLDPVVYFIGFGERGPIKIGYASNVRRRLHCLQTAYVGRLRLLGKVHGSAPAMLALEAELHAKFAHLRLRGEWFSDGDDLLAYIKEIR